jgi:HPt (histidine-containing phosphotransfer) domain-containing protein
MLNKLEDLSAVQVHCWINQEKLLERVGGDQELLESLAGMFPEEVDKGMSSLELARSANNAKQVQMSAHTLKGICNMFDATVAANAALDLEMTASGGALGSDAQVSTLRTELVHAVQAVRQLQAALNHE